MATANSSLDELLHDARSIDDMVRLRFDPIQKDEANQSAEWMVLRAVPHPNSGSATVPGKAIDGTTGEVIDQRGGEPAGGPSILENGTWELIESLTAHPTSAPRGTYSWTAPRKVRVDQMTACDLYSAFSKGGFVLCRFNAEEPGRKRWNPDFLLPLNWQRSVLPAYNWLKTDSVPPAGVQNTPDARMVKLLLDANPILAATAFRLLVVGKLMSAELFQAAIGRASIYVRALFMYTLLITPDLLDEERLYTAFESAVLGAATPDAQRAAGLAVATKRLLHPDSTAGRAGDDHFKRILREWPALHDPYVTEILRTIGA